ncbi:MAG: isoprenyl transferase [Candidatus Hydrogenedentes bacterium]|nr:isoprenyl transferase [Candidatus Hydrogenedentota bacterium]
MEPQLDTQRLPRHIGIIMDGNGRWAAQHGKRRVQGHEAGAASVRAVIKACRELGIEGLSLYAFSTENWRRSKQEVNALFRLLSKYMRKEIEELAQNDVRVRFQGRLDGLPAQARKDVEYCLERTRGNKALSVNVALNYGGRQEIVDAARQIAREVKAGTLQPEEISEDVFARRLYLPEFGDLDLLIRTSGELRVSNFMLWQISYAEIVVTPVLWPDFRKEHLVEAILEFQSRKRRYGGRP